MTGDLCKPEVGGCRFGARVAELRAEGFDIHEERVRQGASRYVLVDVGSSAGEVAPASPPCSAGGAPFTSVAPSVGPESGSGAPSPEPPATPALSADLTEGGAYEVRWIEPLPGMGWTCVARYLPGEPIRWYWRRERLAVAA